MKKTFYLLSIAFLICFQGVAQNMPLPDPNTPNVLFLKYSNALNGVNSYRMSDVRMPNDFIESRFCYFYLKVTDANNNHSGKLIQKLYVIDSEEFAYTDAAVYNSVSLDVNQLGELLRHKSQEQKRAYLDSFQTIYLIDYEQKYTRGGVNKVKILRVKTCNFFL